MAHHRCFACHTGLVDASGEDVSIGPAWRASMMTNSARDPCWQASVRGEVMDHPELRAAIEDECATCHMPRALGPVRISSVLGSERDSVARHVFRGANAYMLTMLREHRAKLGVVATEAELTAAIEATEANLRERSARLRLQGVTWSGGRLEVDVVVADDTGASRNRDTCRSTSR